jgi:hypothetical protein
VAELADRLLRRADDYRALAEEHPQAQAPYAIVELILREIAAVLQDDDQELEQGREAA